MQSTATDVATNLRDLAQRPSVARALEAMRAFLGMEVAYTSEMVGDQTSVRAVDGDSESFYMSEELSLPTDQTYCHHILAAARDPGHPRRPPRRVDAGHRTR